MVTNGKEWFLRKLKPVRDKLPAHYGVFYSKEFPLTKEQKRHLYDVVQGKAVDWEVLDNLKKVVKKYGSKQKETV